MCGTKLEILALEIKKIVQNNYWTRKKSYLKKIQIKIKVLHKHYEASWKIFFCKFRLHAKLKLPKGNGQKNNGIFH